MKMRYKILFACIGALTVSMTVFLFFCYYCLHSGYFSGSSRSEMTQALEQGEQLFSKTGDSGTVLHELEEIYADMDFAFLADNEWQTSADVPRLMGEIDILSAINGRHEICKDYVISATAVVQGNHIGYLMCYVNRMKFEAMTYDFNMPRASGLLGKLAIVGVIITLVIMSLAIYAIQREYEKKEREEKRRKELISNLSHDLRTPLSSVLGYSEMLKNGIYDDEEEQRQYIDIIYRKAAYMEKLLTELLEYSRLEMGTMRLQKEKMDITELVREILIEYYPELERNQYDLEVDIPDEPILGMWDKEKISRVLRNLMDNALKYGMDGKKIRIAVQRQEKQVCLEIQDYGKGIPQKEIPHVTEQFYRADHARNSKKGGMGLGLFIVQEIVRLHNGSFYIESKEQQGAKMCIRLPMNS